MAEELAPSGYPGGVSRTDSTTGAAPVCADSRNYEREGDLAVTDPMDDLVTAGMGDLVTAGAGSESDAAEHLAEGPEHLADREAIQPGMWAQGGQWARTQRKPEPPKLSLVVTNFDAMFDTIEEQWQERALCAQTDPEAFFPEKGGSTREAKRICMGCEVRDECLEYALAHDERFGIWGGLSERERRRLKRGII
ncbi:Transcriptional regulator WhiB [Nocardia sp. RB56]|uniref:Transcriptional regulator WhiB n=2 Tax=Nocardiaceae TaxID=85025 RepID=A0A7K0DS17_9NOCA|nr:Transcriptional regulator WhiB [Nocardia aurantia]